MNRIHITIMPKGRVYQARLGDDVLTVSRTPLLSSARVLLDRGYNPGDAITMSHEGEPIVALKATLGAAARLTVVENDEDGPKFGRYRPPLAGAAITGVRG